MSLRFMSEIVLV